MRSDSKHLNGQVNNTVPAATVSAKKEAEWREGSAGGSWMAGTSLRREPGSTKLPAGTAHRTQGNADVPQFVVKGCVKEDR